MLSELHARPEPFEGMGVSPNDWADCAAYFVRAGQPDRAIKTLEEYFRKHANRVTAYADASSATVRLYAEPMLKKAEFQKYRTMADLSLVHPYFRPIDRRVWVRTLAATGEVERARSELKKILAESPGWVKAEQVKKELFPDTVL